MKRRRHFPPSNIWLTAQQKTKRHRVFSAFRRPIRVFLLCSILCTHFFFRWQGERIGKIGINVCRRWNGTQAKTPTNVNLDCQIGQMFVDFRKEIETTSNTNKQNPKQIHSFGSHANDAKIITDTIQSYSRQRKYMAVDAFPRITWCVSVCVISIGSIQCMRKRRGIRIAGQKIA